MPASGGVRASVGMTASTRMPLVAGGVKESATALVLASTMLAPAGIVMVELGRSIPSASTSPATTV